MAKFGPGHFNFTLMLGEKGFNEIDMALLKHLLFNNKPLAFVRTQCDSAISGIRDKHEDKHDEELSFEDALEQLKTSFGKYITTDVLSKVDLRDMEIFYIGIPPRKFADFARLVNYVLGGELLTQIGASEANEASIITK